MATVYLADDIKHQRKAQLDNDQLTQRWIVGRLREEADGTTAFCRVANFTFTR